MGNITEQNKWETNVYLIEKQDKVLGGEEGKINVQAKQLANRTTYLKNQIENLSNDKAPADKFEELSDLLVGVPIPYPLATVPAGCLAMNGQRFDKNRYPKLGQKYPSGVLPDLRGEFIRGWDNGRGVDAGRGLLSAQGDAIRNIKAGSPVGSYKGWLANGLAVSGDNNGAIRIQSNGARAYVAGTQDANTGNLNWIFWDFDASRVVPTANENRPRNIAYHYICLAA